MLVLATETVLVACSRTQHANAKQNHNLQVASLETVASVLN